MDLEIIFTEVLDSVGLIKCGILGLFYMWESESAHDKNHDSQ